MTGLFRGLQSKYLRQKESVSSGTIYAEGLDDSTEGSSVRKTIGKTIGLVLGILFGIGGAGIAVWYLDTHYQDQEDEIGLIVAEPGPIRIKPEDPGGIKVENQNKLVYERVPGSASNELIENVLPREGLTKVPTLIDSGIDSTVSLGKGVLVSTGSLDEKGYDERSPEAVQLETQSLRGKQKVVPSEDEGEFSDSRVVGVSQQTASSATGSVEARDSHYLVQLAALRTEDAAREEWVRLSDMHGSIIGKFSPMIMRADLAERGVFYRLSAGPFPDQESARGTCLELVQLRVSCLVVAKP